VTQGRVRPLGVVVDPPRLDPFPRVSQREEPAGIETLGADAGVEGFNERVVRRFPRPREVQLHSVQIGPLVEQAASELWTIVDPDRLRLAPFDGKTVEDLDGVEGSEVGSRHRCEALSRAAIHYCQYAEGSAVEQRIRHESIAHTSLGAAIAGRPVS